MNLCRCDKGHFYDKEKYASCPHCGGGAASDDSLTDVFSGDAMSEYRPDPGPVPIPDGSLGNQSELPVGGIPADQPTVRKDNILNELPTVPLTQPLQEETELKTEPIGNMFADSDDGHTVAFYDDFLELAGVSNTQNLQPGIQPVQTVSTPCVGWLVALGGAHIGQDFRLKVGKNFIGRDTQMDIALTGDKSVSRNRHAIVVYEPKQHLYLAQPGDSSGLLYRNNEVVLSPVKLEAYDMLTVGDINLLFMPLCGDRFNWSTLLEELSKKND